MTSGSQRGPRPSKSLRCARHGIDATGFTPQQASQAFDRLKGRDANKAAHMKSPIDGLRELIAGADTHGALNLAGQEISEARRTGKINEQEFQALSTWEVKSATACFESARRAGLQPTIGNESGLAPCPQVYGAKAIPGSPTPTAKAGNEQPQRASRHGARSW